MTKPIMSVRRTALIASILVALGPTSMALYTPAMPQLVEAFSTTQAVITTTLTAYFAGFAFSQLLAGPVADAFGRRPSTLGFIAVYIAGSIVAVFAPTVEILIAARLVQGIGAAIGVTVSRAIVRDLYPGDTGARILNLVAIMLAVAPAMSPALGGYTIKLAGWHSVFILMAAFGIIIGATALFALRETIVPDRSRLRPVRIARAYASLFGNAEFMTASVVVACGVGVFYAQATMLPFVLIDTVGLTPPEFGLAMLFQSGTFMAGSLAMRVFLRWWTPGQLVVPGLAAILAGSAGLAVAPHLYGPSLLSVMVPVSFFSFGAALMIPHMLMASMRPFPKITGQAAAMAGFMQIGSGLLGGMIGAWIGSPVLAISVVIPTMGTISCIAYAFYRRVAKTARRAEDETEPDTVPVAPAG